ncbi:MAG: iron-sulfur cluster assembly accessory protein [Gammaproteobacteria bacterium]|nr:iron-sulfur cluster assembly accessory protein [Gammaproteobacteria bacterium]
MTAQFSSTQQAGAAEFVLTEIAAEKIAAKITERGKGIGIRITIGRTGCSGLAYELEFVDEKGVNDHCFSVAGTALQVYIDEKAWVYVKGSTLDYVKRGINEGFEFINPNEKGRCGCGESFIV